MRSLLIFLSTIVIAEQAHAKFEVCNETDANATVAIAYRENGSWISEGWWSVAANACQTVKDGELTARYFYYTAISENFTWPGEGYFFCTTSEKFTITGDENCEERGYQAANFREVDTGQAESFTFTLTRSETDAQQSPAEEATTQGESVGASGEPYTISGILSHCDVFDASMACEVHADGYRYIASSLDPTPANLLEDLLQSEPNSPITISGDMISYEEDIAKVTIREFAFTGSDPYKEQRAALQGRWQSLDDPNYEVVIRGGVFEELYEQVPTSTSTMFFVETCPDAPEPALGIELKSYEFPEEKRCMIINEISNTLSLFPVGVMNDLNFRRMD